MDENKTLRELLLEHLPELAHAEQVTTALGVLYTPRSDIAPKAFETKLNNPMSPENIGRVLEIALGADPASLERLFSSFNGLRLNWDGLAIYGLYEQLDRSDLLTIQNRPFSILEVQVQRRPAFAPPAGCVVATSEEPRYDAQQTGRLHHLITERGEVVVGEFSRSDHIERSYENVDTWLLREAERAFAASRPLRAPGAKASQRVELWSRITRKLQRQ